MDVRRASAGVGAAALAAAIAAAIPASAGAAGDERPPPKVSERTAIEIADGDPDAREAKREHPDLAPSASRAESDGDWEVGYFADGDQLVQVVVDDDSGRIEESWTGEQVAWKMARGYDGAFGRSLNAPWIWLPLCAIFVLGLLDWRRPLRIAHLDLVVIVAGFGVSHFFFNRGEIGLSVPLAYPALLYLLARTLWIGFRGGGPGGEGSRASAGLRPTLPVAVLAIATLFLLGVRVGLNVGDSNAIDVGYSGVIGADKLADGEPLYGDFPEDNSHGDTYGPFAYYSYLPFEQLLPWSGSWDELPAAHAAAIFFDLATVGALFLLGRRLRPRPREGTALGATLAFGWTACPYTAFALESNTNDALVSLLLVAALVVLSSPPARGALLALASLTKFAPLALAPLFATYRDGEATRSLRTVVPFAAAFAVVVAIAMAQTLLDPGISQFWERSIGNQAGRDSPFSVWGQEPSLGWLHTAVKAAAAALALAVALAPRRRDPVTVAALGAAVLIALQLTVEHWFYLYIPWFLPFLLVALLAANGAAGSAQRGEGPAPAA